MTKSTDAYKQASTGGGAGRARNKSGRRILYYRGRGEGKRGMNNMTSHKKIAILQHQQDHTELSYTDLISAINEEAIPI
jgi:hypothetical protein